ncbi:MAG TPA: hypothetical protein VHB73_03340 [Alphaproteobacteria bacterium]|nr:hypothetical protein [Alphaproteobacteria bacterium]
MRRLLPLFLLLIFSLPAHAQTLSQQCALDQAVDDAGGHFNQCPISGTENAILAQYNGARLQTTNALSGTPIRINGLCRYVDARGINNPLFIPFGPTGADWPSFVNSNPSGVHFAECCLPGPMHVGDVPPVTTVTSQTCAAGWHFDGLANPSNPNQLIATPSSQEATGTLTLVAGQSENPDYPITQLPIQRDDIDAFVPRAAAANQAYFGRYSCVSRSGNTTLTTYALTEFALRCENAAWTAGGVGCIPGTISVFSSPCPNGGSGLFTQGLVRTCPSGQVSVQTLINTCTAACVPGQVGSSFTASCPAGQTGSITRIHVRQCPSGTIVDQDISNTCQPTSCTNPGPSTCLPGQVRLCDSNQCNCTCQARCPSVLCPAGEVSSCTTTNNQCQCTCVPNTCQSSVTNQTRSCPSGQTGSITVQITKTCYSRQPVSGGGGGACSCTTTERQISNTCKAPPPSCPPSTDLGTSTQNCPAGQTGQIVVRTRRICELSSTGCFSCGNESQCTCHNEQTQISNTCVAKPVCPASTDLGRITKSCPAGQTGSIVVQQTKLCRTVGRQCLCNIVETPCSNTCVSSCVPSQRCEVGQCPNGWQGQILKTIAHICGSSGGRDVLIDVNNTCVPICIPGKPVPVWPW